MAKNSPVRFFLILLVSGVITACNQKPGSGAPEPATSGAPTGSVATSGPLNLKISAAIPEHEAQISDFFQKHLVTPSTNASRFQAAPSEERIQVDGKLYTSNDRQNYLRFVDGGEVSLKLKFK